MSWYPKKVDISSTVSLSEAELTMLDAVTPGTTAAGKVVTTAAVTNKVAALDITDLKIGGTSVTATAAQLNALKTAPADHIVVSASGSDTTGVGSLAFPYATITKAFTVWTATRHTIIVLPGEYAEAATLTWPNVTGLSLVGIGNVVISNADAAAQVLNLSPTYTASTFEATITNIAIAADTQIGLKIANAAMTKKLNVYLDGFTASMDTSGDSIDVAGTVAGQAIRIYAKHLDLEGLLHFTINDAGSRLRVSDSRLMGGLTGAGAVAGEVTLLNVTMLTSGITVDGAQQLSNVGCIYATDADPAVYTEFANAYAT
jgi:hypothetical protein